MSVTLTVRDERTDGGLSDTLVLEFLTERITVRELIRSRVYQEVQDHNRKKPPRFRGLVQPEAAETRLNAPRDGRPREVDWKRQFEVACQAFERRGFLVLVGDRQATSLDEEIVIAPDTEVSFLKLVPLVGG